MKRPSLLYFFLEFPRGIWRMLTSLRFLLTGKSVKKGVGKPVLVLPGFFNTDSITFFLRKYLNRSGFRAFGWGLGLNTGSMKNLTLLSEKVQKIYREEGQKVTLIGFSLGGVYARELAKMHPEMVSGLFTMGSPFRRLDAPNNAKWLFELLRFFNPKKKTPNRNSEFFEKIALPASVPTVAFFSKTDGVVAWEACLEEPEDELHENMEIKSSHFGLTLHKEVFRTIGNRMAEQQIGQEDRERMMWV